MEGGLRLVGQANERRSASSLDNVEKLSLSLVETRHAETKEMFATTVRLTSAPPAFSELHKKYVMNLYRRYLRDSLNWHIRRDAWRKDALRIRAEFEFNRHVRNPRELASLLNRAEAQLESRQHPDPYKRTYLATAMKKSVSNTSSSTDVCGWCEMVRAS